MLPTLKQRLLIAVAAVAGALSWLWVAGPLQAQDGSAGIVLADASWGFVLAGLLVLAAGLPALVLGLLSSSMANPLAGPFTVSVGLFVLAWRGGAGYGWLWRATLPEDYLWLLVELVFWLALYMGLVVIARYLRLPLRRRLPTLTSAANLERSLLRDGLRASTWLAGVLAAIVGGLLAWVTVRSVDAGQVFLPLMLSFLVGGLVAQSTVPGANALGIVLAPFGVGIAGYAYMLLAGFGSAEQIQGLVYSGEVAGFAWILPIHYASAGVAGACLGAGIGQGTDTARLQAAATAETL